MKSGRWKSRARSWTGIVALSIAMAAGLLLLAVYVHALRVTPVEKALVDDLKLKAKTDIEVQKILQPELNRQHEVLVLRRNVYSWGGPILLIGAGIFLVWFKWFRPQPGDWEGVPAKWQRLFESRSDHSARIIPPPAPQGDGAPADAESLLMPILPAIPPAPAAPLDLGPVEEILRSEGRKPEAVIPILQAIQARYRYLPEEVLHRICESSEITPAQIAGVASFYSQFRRSPVGDHIIRVCEGTACHVSGAVEVGN